MSNIKQEPAWLRRAINTRLRELASHVKGRVKANSLPYTLLKRVYRHFERSEIELILNSFAKEHPNVFFVQIGSSDGVIGDPIHHLIKRYAWSGILVEPVPYLFERLKENYAGCPNLVFENVGISSEDGMKEFWYPRQQDKGFAGPWWYHQLGSFSRDIILKHSGGIEELEKALVRAEIPCVSMRTLLERNKVRDLDLIHIDTEGYDFEVLKQIDFNKFKPSIILYEHKHLAPAVQANCLDYLDSGGYHAISEGADTLAFL